MMYAHSVVQITYHMLNRAKKAQINQEATLVNKRGKTCESFQLLEASVWAERNKGTLNGKYHEKVRDVMAFAIGGGELKEYQPDQHPQHAIFAAAEALEEMGQRELAISLIESAAYLEMTSIAGPLGHRLEFHRVKRGRKEYPFWDELIDIAKKINAAHLKKHPHRPLKDLPLARQTLDVFLNDFLKPNNICDKDLPKPGTVAQKIKELDFNSAIRGKLY
ncbi:hypothetical protein ACOJUY_004838 [Vibrio alginolyticus]